VDPRRSPPLSNVGSDDSYTADPLNEQSGNKVFAGTLNGSGALRVEVTRRAEESVVARIVAMVEAASATKAAAQLFIEKIEQRYSVGMVTVTVGLLVVPLFFGEAFRPTLLRAMTFMIVASPCPAGELCLERFA